MSFPAMGVNPFTATHQERVIHEGLSSVVSRIHSRRFRTVYSTLPDLVCGYRTQ